MYRATFFTSYILRLSHDIFVQDTRQQFRNYPKNDKLKQITAVSLAPRVMTVN